MAQKRSNRAATKSRMGAAETEAAEKRTYFKQSDFPQANLQQAQRIASAIVENFASNGGSPPDVALALGMTDGRYAGIIRETPTGPFVNLDSPGVPAPTATPELLEHEESNIELPDTGTQMEIRPATKSPLAFDTKLNRVFISHGKQREIVDQIKELLTFGSFEPVVSVERESTAIPVPEKVFEDMRSCGAGVIHVGAEGKYLDKDGNEHTKLNDNVLIEIGAAMALYGKKVILLVERSVTLPSNLQGLYRCDLEGGRLQYDSTMKLLKTFNLFR